MIPFPPQEKEDQQKKDISAVQFSQPQFAQQAGQPAVPLEPSREENIDSNPGGCSSGIFS